MAIMIIKIRNEWEVGVDMRLDWLSSIHTGYI